ncbi:TetR/AcrR family transcriptional regulator [Sorangium sp. So ce296]|uniref:TetR/AcrR family transcriptional regulator n=1 Tax=Sorangium sp. So ce296 TaxID=3133296 RepID=UPI003F6392D8
MTRKSTAPSQRAAQKAATHERIVASASKLMRRGGLAAASVPRVMRGAGLTVGGFYAHFRSKRALDAEVLKATLVDVRATWFRGLEGSEGEAWLARAVRRYLSPAHRDGIAEGCPLPSTLSELTRADKATRTAVVEAFEAAVREIEARAPAHGAATSRERALATMALCVGGLTLARALRGHPVSDEILRACVRWAVPGSSR